MTVWAEGSDIARRYQIDVGAMTITEHSLRDAVLEYESDFPVLARAAARMQPATDTRIMWLRDGQTVVNYTQIFRRPFATARAADDGLIDASLHKHLADIEWALVHGTPQRLQRQLVGFVGGAVHFLGRMPDERDTLILRSLRDLMLRQWQRPGGSWVGEWLSEVSLQVR